MEIAKKFIDLPFRYHLVMGAVIRLLLIAYADFHDKYSDVAYTDIDYHVFTDAARHVLRGNSPYKRHTYRYSPLIAYLLVPNIVIGKNFGKVLFCVFDLLISFAVKLLVEHQIQWKDRKSKIPVYSTLFWLYNPLSVVISTRGNADSVPCFFIILSLLFLQTNIVEGLLKYCLSGSLLGVAIHLRLYPLVFSFPMYLSLGQYVIDRNTGLTEGFISLMPNRKQIILTVSCVSTLLMLTCGMYVLYGYEFLFETYIYHLLRKDTRHNFSVMFYYLYLTMDQLYFDIVKTISLLFECLVLFVISLTFGCQPKTLPFALFCQAAVLVTFNSVMTSQYFIWFLSLLPLVAHNLRMIQAKAMLLATIWVSAQAAWLFYAYMLEFKSRHVFELIWLKGILFFCANVFVLGHLMGSFDVDYGFNTQLNVRKNK
ncbi:GPI mannosyltransferase 1 [Plodia interpunctella]|uniref:GPI mannosyltransferase 1 n=1 Tax=Plodia interpunctella TaxID=58824 RepID=UPI00236815B2|nr:GPI mannosyltransferase 1 [Plodia interpunctella]